MSFSNYEMIQELQDVFKKLQDTKNAIEDGVDYLEKGKKARDTAKKEILVREMKQALAILNDTDTKIVKDLKGEAFDLIRSMSKISEEVSALKGNFIDDPEEDTKRRKVDIESLKDKVKSLGLDTFLSSLNISVSIQPGFMTSAFEKISDAIFLNSPVLNPKQFFLEIPERLSGDQSANYNPNYLDINIYTVSESLSFNSMVLQKLQVDMTCEVPGQGKVVLEESSVWSKLEKMKAKISEDGGYVTVQLRRPSDIFGRISVRVLGSNIVNSPLLHRFSDKENRDVSSHQLTVANDSIDIFSMTVTGLDESDLTSLDMTTRRQMLLSAGKQQLLSNPTFPASPALQPHRKVSRQPNISSVPEAHSLDHHSQLSESNLHNPGSAVTLPLVDTDTNLHEDCQEDDPHLMLNASKAPSPQSLKCWQKEDTIWDDVPDSDQEDDDDTDPHLMLNASKAPPAGIDWPTVDPIWNSNTSLLPEADLYQSAPQDQNQTIWGEDLLGQVNKFDFLLGSVEVEEVFKSQVTSSSRRGTNHCLESPCCLTFLPQMKSFLVTEPVHNRVGLYEEDSFKFTCWMGYPGQVGNGRTFYNYPTSLLALDNGFVVLLEKDRLHIFDGQVAHLQSIGGVFHGLAEKPGGEIFTLSTNSEKELVLKKLVREGSKPKPGTHRRSHYLVGGQIKLSVVQTFNDWATISKARFLTYSQGKVFITDLGLHKLYTVNLTTGEQSASGYMGSKMGQFKRPTGLLADDNGNLIVGDSENNRLVVINKEGQIVKVVAHHDGQYCFPHDLVRVDNTLLAVYMATRDGEQGVIVRYRVKVPGDSGDRTELEVM